MSCPDISSIPAEVGMSIPPNTAHAVSVSLPTWEANVAYEEGKEWVLKKMVNGYPRFYIHKSISTFADAIVAKYGSQVEQAILFPSIAAATRSMDFFLRSEPTLERGGNVRILRLVFQLGTGNEGNALSHIARIFAVIFPRSHFAIAKTFWQHTGDGVSSRRAEFCHKAFEEGHMIEEGNTAQPLANEQRFCKGPRRYQRGGSLDQKSVAPLELLNGNVTPPVQKTPERKEHVQFVEERFGRNLDLSLAANAKIAIKRRIAGALTADVDLHDALARTQDKVAGRQVRGFSEDDVFLYPCGMSSIFNAHRTLMKMRGTMKSICFGFPYIDTLKVLEKWGPGCLFYGHGSSLDLDDLEHRCKAGERFLAIFCEFPGNPLLTTPDILRIRSLANRYDFAVVVDETIGNFMNVHVLPYADVLVSSLTKVFSGDSNVMGGSYVLNPKSRYYAELRKTIIADYEDNYWPEDAIFMERNSRDFVARIERINTNAEAICKVLQSSPLIKKLYYPKWSPTKIYYDQCRNANGGYGGLLSVTFHSTAAAILFFDTLQTEKGPSLGTNFTLSSPYVILAYYNELEWAAQFGVEADLVRVSVGLEDTPDLIARFERALGALEGRNHQH